MPDKRNRSDSESNSQPPIDLTMSSPIAATTAALPFPTTSRPLRPRSQSRALSNNSRSKSSKSRARAVVPSTRRTRSQSTLSLSTSEPRLQTDVGEASGSPSGSGSASASLSRHSPGDVGSLVIESTLADVRDVVNERQLVLDEEAGPSSGVIDVSPRGEAGSSRRRKRRRVDSSGSGSDDGDHGLVETSGNQDRERDREYSHPPIAFLTAPPMTSPNGGPARIRELINRRGATAATTLSPTSPSRQPVPSSSSSRHPDFSSRDDPFVSNSIPAPPSTSMSTSASTSSQSTSAPSLITTTPAPPTSAPPLSTYTCPICFSPPTNATLTPCGHVCCGACLFTAVKATLQRGSLMAGGGAGEENFPRCPVCRARIPGWDGRGGGVIGLKVRTIFSL